MKKDMLCTTCGYTGPAKKGMKGYLWLELLLWITFIIPGVVYSIWRTANRTNECPKCKSLTMIPLDSPKAQEMINGQK